MFLDSFNFLVAVEETLCHGKKGMPASIQISRKRVTVVQVNLKSYIITI
jgi:hypothetical protein